MSAAFDAVFGFFVASMLAIAFTAVRWGHRRDRAARTEAARRDATPPPADGSGRGRAPGATGGTAS